MSVLKGVIKICAAVAKNTIVSVEECVPEGIRDRKEVTKCLKYGDVWEHVELELKVTQKQIGSAYSCCFVP